MSDTAHTAYTTIYYVHKTSLQKQIVYFSKFLFVNRIKKRLHMEIKSFHFHRHLHKFLCFYMQWKVLRK